MNIRKHRFRCDKRNRSYDVTNCAPRYRGNKCLPNNLSTIARRSFYPHRSNVNSFRVRDERNGWIFFLFFFFLRYYDNTVFQGSFVRSNHFRYYRKSMKFYRIDSQRRCSRELKLLGQRLKSRTHKKLVTSRCLENLHKTINSLDLCYTVL